MMSLVLLHQCHISLALCHAREPPRVFPLGIKPYIAVVSAVVSADLVHWFVSESNFALQANLYCPHYMWWVSQKPGSLHEPICSHQERIRTDD